MLTFAETPSQTNPEKMFYKLCGQPLTQSNWHIKLVITESEALKDFKLFLLLSASSCPRSNQIRLDSCLFYSADLYPSSLSGLLVTTCPSHSMASKYWHLCSIATLILFVVQCLYFFSFLDYHFSELLWRKQGWRTVHCI